MPALRPVHIITWAVTEPQSTKKTGSLDGIFGIASATGRLIMTIIWNHGSAHGRYRDNRPRDRNANNNSSSSRGGE